ncbi:sensor histidine kinase [Flavisolibacter tropicus]|uniref:histidine kinase n=1 Tax=Flavisolibacter tropicus TaxID=1492898 RepID=A0A172TVJ1_9BACT|nr:PAS domain-containing sensor histidine kinase [Flavisolibacter tropicus]ANE50757.1 histidine kinase [Flavisolibacter tropicus]
MIELAKVTLQNEMDLILAHKRSMKLAELVGLSLSAQTTFATAVSEVSRSAIENGKNSCLILSVSKPIRNEKYIVAAIKDTQAALAKNEGFEYAKRLVNKFLVSSTDNESTIELYFLIPASHKIGYKQIEEWKELFVEEPPVSPYEEIKRKNEQLQLLAAKLQESENQYRTLTNALPLIIFSIDEQGKILYANEGLSQFTGQSIEDLNQTQWRSVIHPVDYDPFAVLMNDKIMSGATNIKLQCRLKNNETGEYLWHMVSISPLTNDKGAVLYWIGFMVDINAQKVFEQTLKDNKELKEVKSKLEENIQELNRSNRELQQFAYVASHDLQEPIRKVIYYSDYLLVKYEKNLDKKGSEYLRHMISASHRMRNLIKDLLSFSQVDQKQYRFETLDLSKVAQEALQDLELVIKEKLATINISELPPIEADHLLMRQLFENLISNALKYNKEGEPPVIEISHENDGKTLTLFFNDQGIGFNEKYLDRMFNLFQRLHGRDEYSGTGLGLAICRKITEVHNGRITAKSQESKGATFIVQLPIKQTGAV